MRAAQITYELEACPRDGFRTVLIYDGQQMIRKGATPAQTTRSVAIAIGWVTTPGNITFANTLNGTDQIATATLALDVGSGVITGGWNITATSTAFTAGIRNLAAAATTILIIPTRACDTTCTLATTNVTYPYTLPAATTAPTATKLFNAQAGTGNGNQTITPTFTLTIPANTYAGTYTSTWTITISSGP